MTNLFDRLGRPPPIEKTGKQQLKNTNLITQWDKDTKIKTFLMDLLAKDLCRQPP